MAEPPLVFICYSRKDHATLQELRTYLTPFESRGELRLWYDLQIAAGDTPDARIQSVIRDASIALMLVSPDFLASAYIANEELPAILKAAHADKLKAVPFFIEPSMVQNKLLTFTTENANEPFLLTYWQGLNEPKPPLPEKGRSRKQGLVDACTKLLELAKSLPPPRKSRPKKATRSPTNGRRPEVTIRLTMRGRQVHRTFLGPAGPLMLPSATECPSLDGPLGHALGPDQLFQVLFHSDAECTQLLEVLRGRGTRITPVSLGGARVRLVTDEPQLLLQPWSSIAWKGNLLAEAGWSFEFVPPHPAAVSQNYEALRLDLPCYITIAVADSDGQMVAAPHAEAMRTISEQAAPKDAQPAVAHNWAELERSWRNRPEVFYFHGRAKLVAEELRLVLPGNGKADCSLSDLERLWQHHRPRLAIFNLVDAPHGATQRAMAKVAALVPLLILQTSALAQIISADHNPRAAAERLLQSLLHDPDIDPVQLVATTCLPATAVWTNFSQFSRTKDTKEPWLSPWLDLDREDQRAQALDLCDKLVKDTEARTALLLAYGEPRNHLGDLGSQVEARLKESLSIRRIRCTIGQQVGAMSPSVLAQDVNKKFEVPYGTTLQATLSRRYAEWFPRKAIGLILLDVGAYGGSQGSPLTAADVAHLVTYLRDMLPQDCPANVRIAALLTLEVLNEKLSTIADLAERQGRITPNQQFRLKALHPVGEVKEADLFTYLKKRRSGCPLPLAASFAHAVYTSSKGNFEAACSLIDDAHKVGWNASFLAELERAMPTASLTDTNESQDPL